MSESAIVSQLNPSATTLTTLHTVSSEKRFAGDCYVCNRSATDTTFRLSIAKAGAADANEQYIAYDNPVVGNTTVAVGPIVAPAGAVIRAYATLATLSFNLVGTEY